MPNVPANVLITNEQIKTALDRLSSEINRKYQNEELLVIGILKGSFIFMADLVRKLTCPVRLDFMGAQSYGSGTISCGRINVTKECDLPIRNQNVLIIEDIVDSGCTTGFLRKYFEDRGAKSVRLCALVSKPSRRKVDVDIDFLGFEIPDEFVVGYGLDYDESFRNLTEIRYIQ